MRANLLHWQREIYDGTHADRTNLLIHLATWPVFVGGFVSLMSSPVAGWPFAVGGLVAMAGAMALQGRGHQREGTPPAPFEDTSDKISRIFAEQLITFPRFLLDGGFARAWRAAQ